jgi:Glycosyl hydrolase family 95 catalytic domain/Glycoside hydrolase family 95, C-terminal domain
MLPAGRLVPGLMTLTNPAQPRPGSAAPIDMRALISRSDLVYTRPPALSQAGIPLGNGRMGTLIWTTPSQLRMQINRVDVYGNNCESNSFFERHQDYCGGCAYLDIGFSGQPFPQSGFHQHLSVYDGALTIEANGVSASAVAWPEQDVIAIAVDDRRSPHPEISITLRMLRYEMKYGSRNDRSELDHVVAVPHLSQTATSRLLVNPHPAGDRIALTQEFREDAFCSRSAVAVAATGGKLTAEFVNESDVRLRVSGHGPIAVFIASAASFDPNQDLAAQASLQLDAALAKGKPQLQRETAAWWHNFWSRSYVSLHSDDGAADYVQQNYHYFLYLMGASSRGKFPPKFNGMLWSTGGDLRTWGGQHWFANLSCYYEALPAANRLDLMDPMYDMYSGMFDRCALAAQQQWGSQGVYIPETVYFDGLEKLPDAIAAEMRELYLLQKPWEQRSKEFMDYALTKNPQSSRWNWIQVGNWQQGRYGIKDRGYGPYGPTNHNFGSNAKIAYLFWRRYEYTLDRDWLLHRAYPMLRGAVELYRNHPNLKKGNDGKYHLGWSNSNESVYGARDTDEDVASMRGATSALLRASAILGADAAMRPTWQEFLDLLPPLPDSSNPDALSVDGYQGPTVWVRGLKPAVKPGGMLPDANSLPAWFFDFCNVEGSQHPQFAIAQATFDHMLRGGLRPDTPVGILSKLAIAAASLGRADAVQVLIPNQMRLTGRQSGAVMANRMTELEGPQATDAERLGRASEALHLALLQSNPPWPGEDPVLHVFPAWPKEWSARYTLLARGGFLVTSSMNRGSVEYVELESQAGAPCKLRNPFSPAAVLFRNGTRAETLQGPLLEFKTSKGERISILPSAKHTT